MEKILKMLCAVVLVFLGSCDDDRLKERPDDIITTTVPPEVFQKIVEQFPESQNIKNSQQHLFDAGALKQITLTNDSEVYVTYVAEGAGYQNTFGWYSYPAGSPPTEPSQLELHVLFPTVSDRILKQGDMLQLGEGKFSAGTVIGFFLIIRGWEGLRVHYDRETFFTDFTLNPDDQQQHVLFKHKDLGDVILTFEDELTSRQSDQDFNDIIFTVTDNRNGNEVTNFDLTNVKEL